MNKTVIVKILSDYEENGCGFCHQGGDEVPQAFEMAVKALKYDDTKYHEEHGEVIVSKDVWEDAKKALEAWEKVIEEIEQLRAKFKGSGGVYEHSAYGLDYATEIINKHLSEDKK